MKGDVNVDIKETSVSVQAAGNHNKKTLKKLSIQAAEFSTMTHPVLGTDVKFTLKEIPANHIERGTMVWLGNERDQDILDIFAVEDLIPSFKDQGQQVPAYGRDVSGITEIADGSRRRFTALETKRPFYVWVGDLNSEQMQYLSEIGNQYKETSAFEKGKRYIKLLENSTQEQVSESIKISRKAIMRCVKTAKLPIEIISCFQSPNDLSARQGELFFKSYADLSENEQVNVEAFCIHWLIREKGTEKYSNEELIKKLTNRLHSSKQKPESVKPRELAMGASVLVKGGNATINVPNVSDKSLSLIEKAISTILDEEALIDILHPLKEVDSYS